MVDLFKVSDAVFPEVLIVPVRTNDLDISLLLFFLSQKKEKTARRFSTAAAAAVGNE